MSTSTSCKDYSNGSSEEKSAHYSRHTSGREHKRLREGLQPERSYLSRPISPAGTMTMGYNRPESLSALREYSSWRSTVSDRMGNGERDGGNAKLTDEAAQAPPATRPIPQRRESSNLAPRESQKDTRTFERYPIHPHHWDLDSGSGTSSGTVQHTCASPDSSLSQRQYKYAPPNKSCSCVPSTSTYRGTTAPSTSSSSTTVCVSSRRHPEQEKYPHGFPSLLREAQDLDLVEMTGGRQSWDGKQRSRMTPRAARWGGMSAVNDKVVEQKGGAEGRDVFVIPPPTAGELEMRRRLEETLEMENKLERKRKEREGRFKRDVREMRGRYVVVEKYIGVDHYDGENEVNDEDGEDCDFKIIGEV